MPVTSKGEMIKVEDERVEDEQYLATHRHIPERQIGSVALLFLHGWRRPPNDRAARFVAQHGYDSLVVNFRGHNGSGGDIRQVSRQDALHDSRVAYDYYRRQLSPETRIGLVTHSFSAYEGILLTCERDVACISLRAPANYPDEGFAEPQYGKGHVDPVVMAYRRRSLHWSENMALTALHKYRGRVQIIESGRDTYIPHQTIENYRHAVPAYETIDDHFMPDWEHLLDTDSEKLQQYEEELLLPWLQNSVEPALRLQ